MKSYFMNLTTGSFVTAEFYYEMMEKEVEKQIEKRVDFDNFLFEKFYVTNMAEFFNLMLTGDDFLLFDIQAEYAEYIKNKVAKTFEKQYEEY